MNTARAGRVGVNRVQLFQLAGSLDAVVAVVGKYPETGTGETKYDQFIAHLVADPEAERGQLVADEYQFPVEEPQEDAYYIVECFENEHQNRKNYADCTFKCTHAPLPSLFPNLNWTFEKGHSSYDQRRAEFGRKSDLDNASQAPKAAPRPGYEAALDRLKVMVSEATSLGLRALRLVISATNPLTLPPHKFSDQRVGEQQALINRCAQVCHEIGGHVDMELRNVDSLRKFIGPTNVSRPYTIQDHAIPKWQ
ncbi:hypothetical protein INS49_009632 [Diaporthe citri]|uniref:uncharacterized protein n=1 Tax=Diaporthe citri TaxID=83186 RepID=UPI001C7F2BDC|nr:uncharacterized protein INS49_009632 [Diaporthe citri]KAG6361405.1 hypothetical protein INS49_009632 [Diaporthe citri]